MDYMNLDKYIIMLHVGFNYRLNDQQESPYFFNLFSEDI